MVTKYDVVVIGAGIFGSLVTRALRVEGHRVLAIDDKRPEAGSAPAACLMKPSWFSSLGKNVYEPALKKLDELVGVQDIQFAIPTGKLLVHWCNPKQVMLDQNEVKIGQVTRLLYSDRGWLVKIANGLEVSQVMVSTVVAATGIWTKLLFSEIDVVGQGGVAWLWPKAKTAIPRITPWAPYKQLVRFNRGDGLWAGDGTSLRNLDYASKIASRIRCQRFVEEDKSVTGKLTPPIALMGYRPYVKDAKPCFLKQVRPGFWVATGGAKNGTLAAGWCADQMVRALS